MNKWIVRIKTFCRLFFKTKSSWLVIEISDENIINVLKEQPSSATVSYNNLDPYVGRKLIKSIANSFDNVDMLCDKLEFEEKVETLKNKNK